MKVLVTGDRFRLSAVCAWTIAFPVGHQVAYGAEPAQVPLTSVVAEPPPPNVMVTIDDSGSMLSDFVPEGTFTVNGKSVTLATDWIGAYPFDLRKTPDGKIPGNFEAAVVTAVKNTSPADDGINQVQYRSSDLNAIWYNPEVRYDPWYKPDGSGRMANSPPAAARWDPIISNGTFDLTKTASFDTRWYTPNNTYTNANLSFSPGLYYRLKTPGSDPTVAGNYNRYDVNVDGQHTDTSKKKASTRTDCVGEVCTQLEERQNFANWFTYYRMRESFTKAAVADSLVSFKDKLRVGWARINKDQASSVDGVNFKMVEKGVRQLDANHLQSVLEGVNKISSWPRTPLRLALKEVGRYFDESTPGRPTGSPWLTDPASSGSGKYDCRRSVNLLMTDGYYNDDNGEIGVGDVDRLNGGDYADSNPLSASPTRYEAKSPFTDTPGAYADTLADVATKYFATDLDGSLANRVAPVTGDVAFWQHLTQFTVGLGVKGTLDSTDKTTTIKRITAGDLSWPDPNAGSPQKIDDMWHAAVNTGGDFYSVRNVTELTAALKDAFGKAAGNEAKDAGVATVSSTLTADNVKYVPKYKSVDWYGDLEAWPLDIDGRQGNLPDWRASEKLPAHSARNLFTWDATKAVPFTWAGMGANNQKAVGSEDLTNYIRGDTSKEGTNQPFRLRGKNVLGDFVNSPPVVIRDHVDLGYEAIDSSYASYMAAKKARSSALVMVGGNSGILHGFNSTNGVEVFGFVPQASLNALSTVASKDYGTTANYHKFFVDGTITETDAFVSTPGSAGPAWSNVVVGSMGGGAKAFFALHVPTDNPTALGANAVMWELNGANDADIGYMFSDFAVGKVQGGDWYAFASNGIYSQNGNAVLLVINLTTGAIEKRITVDSSGKNGLMGVTLVKDATSKEVVAAYAGDLLGNVWRFDFEGPSAGEWKAGFKGQALFKATSPSGKTAQPIVTAPVYVDHTRGGRLVLFGTGKLIDVADSANADAQTLYGVWDKTTVGVSSSTTDSPFLPYAVDRDKLHAQFIGTEEIKGGDGNTYYSVTTTPVKWDDGELGWYADQPFKGQRVVYPTQVIGTDYVLFSTIVPATKAEICRASSGVGYNYILTAEEGLQPEVPIIDTNGDGVVDDKDAVASGYGTTSDGRDAIISDPQAPLFDDKSGGEGQICDTSGQCKNIKLPCVTNCSATGTGITDRVWKQLITPPTAD